MKQKPTLILIAFLFMFAACQKPTQDINKLISPRKVRIKISAITQVDTSTLSTQQRDYCFEAYDVNYIILNKDSLREIVTYKNSAIFKKDTFNLKIGIFDSLYPGPFFLEKYGIRLDRQFGAIYTEYDENTYSFGIDSIYVNDAFERDSCSH